jgi:TonB family protein
MSAGTSPALTSGFITTRKVPRYKLTVPLRLTVLRSGVPDDIPGRTLEIGEGGVGVAVASQLLLGESVRVEFLLPHMTTPVRATAVVRYQREGNFGLQFLRLPVEQQSIIRYWTRREADVQLVAPDPFAPAAISLAREKAAPLPLASTIEAQTKRTSRISLHLVLVASAILVAAMLGWWHWQNGWADLEAKVPDQASESASPQLQVAPDEMRRRLTHEVRPEYPEGARQASQQGKVVIDAVVSASGEVAQTKIVSGDPVFANAARDAVRWWRYEPYLLNGQAVPVETTITVDFRLKN